MGGLRGLGVALLLLAANACAPLSIQQGARTVRPGETQAGMSVTSVSVNDDEENVSETTQTAFGVIPNAWVRRGLGSSMDMGAQFYSGGVRIDGKYAFVQSDAFAVAAMVGIGGGYQTSNDEDAQTTDTSSHHLGDLGLLATIGVGKSLDVNIGLRGMFIEGHSFSKDDEFDTEDKENAHSQLIGGALGVVWKRGDLAVRPEIAVYTVESKYVSSGGGESDGEGLYIVPSLGFSVGF